MHIVISHEKSPWGRNKRHLRDEFDELEPEMNPNNKSLSANELLKRLQNESTTDIKPKKTITIQK